MMPEHKDPAHHVRSDSHESGVWPLAQCPRTDRHRSHRHDQGPDGSDGFCVGLDGTEVLFARRLQLAAIIHQAEHHDDRTCSGQCRYTAKQVLDAVQAWS